MTPEQEKEQLYTFRWFLDKRYGDPAAKDSMLEILADLLGDQPEPVTPAPTHPQPVDPTKVKRQLWLTAGHGGSDPGIVAHGRKESEEAIALRDLIKNKLVADGFKVWTDPNNWKTSDTAPYLMEHTEPSSICVDLHFNGGGGSAKGVEVLTPKSYTSFEKKLAQRLAKAVADVIGSPLRGDAGQKTEADSQHGRLAMMRPPGENVLIEVCFLDNAAEMARYVEKRDAVANAIAAVLREFLLA